MKNRWIVLGAVVSLAAPLAWASLGQKPSPTTSAVVGLQAPTTTARVVARSVPNDVQIHSSAGPYGIPVQEYIGADGRLFAITWAGPQPVSAETVVTRFFPQVHIGEPHTAHGVQVVVRSVRQPWGAEGVAYVPSLMPMDFDPNGLAP